MIKIKSSIKNDDKNKINFIKNDITNTSIIIELVHKNEEFKNCSSL